MPELPDITVYIEALETRILGQRLEGVRIISPFLLRSEGEEAVEAASGGVWFWEWEFALDGGGFAEAGVVAFGERRSGVGRVRSGRVGSVFHHERGIREDSAFRKSHVEEGADRSGV